MGKLFTFENYFAIIFFNMKLKCQVLIEEDCNWYKHILLLKKIDVYKD